MPEAQAREEDGKHFSSQVFGELTKMNILPMRLGPGSHLKGLTLMGGIIEPEEFDYFHELTMVQEIARIHHRSLEYSLAGGTIIGMLHGLFSSKVI